jgi:hypothetical protein
MAKQNVTSFLPGLTTGVYFLMLVLLYSKLTWVAVLSSMGIGAVTHSLSGSYMLAGILACVALFVLTSMRRAEGFNTRTPPTQIAELLRSTAKANAFPADKLKYAPETIVTMGWDRPGFGLGGPLVEGFEDQKTGKPAPADEDKNEKEAEPLTKKDPTLMPFKLGEIPAQVKNGPHIDATSTLLKALENLKPDQITAMTKDTQQLIDTQKSLMGMLSSMKPMLNDGKELMSTFQQMFGDQLGGQ